MYRDFIKWIESKNSVSMEFDLSIDIHPHINNKIIINIPGVDGSINGYKDKYKTLADHMIEKGLGAVVRIPNNYTFGFGWDINLRQTIHYCLANSNIICGSSNPEIMLMGFSAGAGAIGMLAWEYPEISKILLLEPALAVGEVQVLSGLKQFTGEAYVIVGSGPNALGPDVGNKVLESLIKANKKELFVIDNCDHQFKGETNSRIISQAPIYAFSDNNKINFPNPKGGFKLYD